MTHCNHGEHSHSNWECFFKSRACRRRYMARSIISRNNGGEGEQGAGKPPLKYTLAELQRWGLFLGEGTALRARGGSAVLAGYQFAV